jgi:multidrug efflux pump subunit AcrA (membrane-fusion protein)
MRPIAPDWRTKLVKKLLIVLIFVALGLAGLASYTKYSNTHPTEYAFNTAKMDFGDMRDIVGVQALLRPKHGRPVFSKIAGQVVDFKGKSGDLVEEDQLLVQLDPKAAALKRDEAAAAVEAAEAAVDAAKANLARAEAAHQAAQRVVAALKELPSGRVERAKAEGEAMAAEAAIKAAKGTITLAQAKAKAAQTQLAEANYGLELTTIRVPPLEFEADKPKQPGAGDVQSKELAERPKRKYVVLECKVERGQNVDTKEPLYLLAADLEEMEATALVPESQIDRVGRGQEAQFWVDAIGEEHKIKATVAEIRLKPATQQGAVYFPVLLHVKNQRNDKTREWQFRPGMTAQVEIVDRTHPGVWKLPVNARSFTLDEHHQTAEAKAQAAKAEQRLDMSLWTKIWILRDNKPWPVFVRLGGVNAKGDSGIKDAEYYEILEWDEETKPAELNPKNKATYPDVIIGAPPKKSMFELPNIKF